MTQEAGNEVPKMDESKLAEPDGDRGTLARALIYSYLLYYY